MASSCVNTRPRYEALAIPEARKHGSVPKCEAQYIHALVRGLKPKATLEVGLGFGASAAFIVSAARAPHYVIDPNQDDYGGLGLANLRKLGLDNYVTFFAEPSHVTLPRLLDQGVRVDFVFIDGAHNFDGQFIDFYYSELLLSNGGHILMHDAWMRSTQHVASWVRTNKANFAAVPTPQKNLILFRKRREDRRDWNHFRGFWTWKSLWSQARSNWQIRQASRGRSRELWLGRLP